MKPFASLQVATILGSGDAKCFAIRFEGGLGGGETGAGGGENKT